MGGIGIWEMLAIVVLAILIYGKDLPVAARKAARAYGKIRRTLGDMKSEFQRHIPDEEIKSIQAEVSSEGDDEDPYAYPDSEDDMTDDGYPDEDPQGSEETEEEDSGNSEATEESREEENGEEDVRDEGSSEDSAMETEDSSEAPEKRKDGRDESSPGTAEPEIAG